MTMKKIKLFDYQEDMVKRVQEAFKHHDAVMVQMPTGTGKDDGFSKHRFLVLGIP